MEYDDAYFAPRDCLREPIPELFECALMLERAVTHFLAGNREQAEAELRAAEGQPVADWIDSMWGKRAKWPDQVHYKRYRQVPDLPPYSLKKEGKIPKAARVEVLTRDGFSCRYCGLPVVPCEVREYFRTEFPAAARWGGRNADQHVGFQTLWLQYDHVLPASRGGKSIADNLVVCCAGCNYCKEGYHLLELGLNDPRERAPVETGWDGLVRVLPCGLRSYQ